MLEKTFIVQKQKKKISESPTRSMVQSSIGSEFNISVKAYGNGPLQLSTDKTFSMFLLLEQEEPVITKKISSLIDEVFLDPAFRKLQDINILPLIYDKKNFNAIP